jgi:hypothetical protein
VKEGVLWLDIVGLDLDMEMAFLESGMDGMEEKLVGYEIPMKSIDFSDYAE